MVEQMNLRGSRRATERPALACVMAGLLSMVGCGDDGVDDTGRDPVGGDGDGSGGLGGGDGDGFGNPNPGTGGTMFGDGDAPGDGDGEPDCGNVEITPMAEFSPGNILIIFDRSVSMNTSDFNGMTRFDAANIALLTAIDPFTCADAGVNPDGTPCTDPLTIATVLFPQNGGSGLFGECTAIPDLGTADHIDWMKSTDWIPAWMSYWGSHALELGTPIVAAFETADRAIQSLKNGMPVLDGNTAVIFVTDGEGTCTGASTAAGLAGQWAGDANYPIDTYVVNVNPMAGGAGTQFNDAVAAAGNTGTSVNPANQVELQNAMSMILQSTASVASCDITLTDGALDDLQGACDRGTVLLGPDKLACDANNGFQVTGPSQMELFGTACDQLMAGGILHASFPCDVVVE